MLGTAPFLDSEATRANLENVRARMDELRTHCASKIQDHLESRVDDTLKEEVYQEMLSRLETYRYSPLSAQN